MVGGVLFWVRREEGFGSQFLFALFGLFGRRETV